MDIICFVNTEHILQNHGERKLRLDSGLETYTLHDQTVRTIFFKPPFPTTPSSAGWRTSGRAAPRVCMTYGRSPSARLSTPSTSTTTNKWPELRRRPPRLADDAAQRPSRRPTTTRRLRPPPPCPCIALTRPKRPIWRPPTPPSRTPCAAARCDDPRLGVNEEKSTPTEFVFPNQTQTQNASLIPTPRLYTKDRTSL